MREDELRRRGIMRLMMLTPDIMQATVTLWSKAGQKILAKNFKIYGQVEAVLQIITILTCRSK